MDKILKILFVEDVKSDAELIWRTLSQSGITFINLLVDNRKDYLKGLETFNPDIIISDYSLPQFDGMTALLLRNEHALFIPFILVTGSINEVVAVECMKSGADDYVLKDNLSRLGQAINNSLKKIELLKQKRDAEVALRESEERFRILYNDAVVGLYRTNLIGEIFLANTTLVKMLGFESFEELASRNLNKSGFGSSSQRKQFIERIEKEGQVKDFEAVWVRRDGTEIFVRENAKAILDSGGKTKYFDGTVEDITDKKKAEKELLESEERYRLLVEKSPDTIAIHDGGKLVFLNPAGTKLIGAVDPQVLLNKSIIDVVHPDSRKNVIERMEMVARGKEAPLFEEKFVKLDGSVIDVEVIGIPIPYKGHNATQVIVRDITLRKKSDSALKESEEKYRSIFENIQDLYYESSMDGTILEVSPSISILSGGQYGREDLIGRSMYDFYSFPGERELLIAELQSKGSITDFEIKLKNRDGSMIPCSISSKISFDLQGRPVKIIGSMRDISERKKAEEALFQSKKEFQNYFELGSVGMSVTLADKSWIEVNQRLCNMFGYTREELTNMTWIAISHPDDIAENLDLFNKAVNGDLDRYEIDKRFIKKNGSIIYVNLSVVCQRNIDGSIHHFLSSYLDITERKKAEEDLLHSYAFNESLLKTIPFGMHIVDNDGTILFQSDNFKRVFGENKVGNKCWDLYRDDKKQCIDCPLIKGIEVGVTEAYESHGVMGGRIFEINHTGMIYQGKKAMLEIFQDITDRKENEAELISSKEKAEESDRLKTAFLHNISHEIRTPMNAIVGFSALLGEQDIDAETRSSYVETIMQSSNHLLSIINDIVDISNIEANLVKIAKNEININSLIKSVCNVVHSRANEKKIRIICESKFDETEALILTDSTKLTQVLTNLVNNAIKFTENGFVKVVCKDLGKTLHIEVSDTGIGIPVEYHGRIFDRFFQVQDSISRIFEGTGLGLAISKAYVELMGGKIRVESEPGKGSTFIVNIPYEQGTKSGKSKTEIPLQDSLTFKKKKKILVAEDVSSNYKLITYFFKDMNAEIVRAENGKIAVEKCLHENNFDLILMDIKMPVMDGYTAVKLIREANIKVPIIAQTAYVDDRSKAIACGCSGFISKPFDKKTLLKVIGEFLQ